MNTASAQIRMYEEFLDPAGNKRERSELVTYTISNDYETPEKLAAKARAFCEGCRAQLAYMGIRAEIVGDNSNAPPLKLTEAKK